MRQLTRDVHFIRLVAGAILFACSFAKADNVYVSTSASAYLGNAPTVRFDSSGQESVFADEPWQGFIEGLAFNSSGNLYAAHWFSGTIVKFDANGEESVFASGLNTPMGLAFDNSGNLYVSSYADGTIQKFDSDGHGSLFASGIPWATGLAIDSSGNLYVGSSYGSEKIFKFDLSGQRSLFASSGIANPRGMAFDSNGNLYVANFDNSTIKKFSSTGDDLGVFASTDHPLGLAFDSSGYLYVANHDSCTITKFDSSGQGSLFATDEIRNLGWMAIQVPEPTTWSLLALGALTLLGGLHLRRR
jgi:DNA-binding beta-propeller fold protein YncE